ncbi:Uncharacterized membrane protein [Bryocella elongata]|uniref:Uncharacterized membrane protein n=1 Tax=Bryocella elongata TaxID=863522 RepID=A0A1H5ZL73_9BACT|nr:Uncharacterized membrane protein [Bryocella elongata]
MFLLFLALCEGCLAGLRPFTTAAILSWAIHFSALELSGTSLAVCGTWWLPITLSVLAIAELIRDKLSTTRCRRSRAQFALRLCVGLFCGAALSMPHSVPWWPMVIGAVGATIGTFAGSTLRRALSRALDGDMPIAFLEDAVAIFGGLSILSQICYK